jgi:CrcB protein
MTDRRELAAVFAGGFAGAIARAVVVGALPAGDGWPWATFLVNVAGAFALGALLTRLPSGSLGRPLLGTGVCGALTTFSAMQLELLRMLDGGDLGLALLYAAGSVAAGLLAVAVTSA